MGSASLFSSRNLRSVGYPAMLAARFCDYVSTRVTRFSSQRAQRQAALAHTGSGLQLGPRSTLYIVLVLFFLCSSLMLA